MSVPGAGIDAHLRVSDLAVQAAKEEIAGDRDVAPAPTPATNAVSVPAPAPYAAPNNAEGAAPGSARKSRPQARVRRPTDKAQIETNAPKWSPQQQRPKNQRGPRELGQRSVTELPRRGGNSPARRRATPASQSPPSAATTMRRSTSALLPAAASGKHATSGGGGGRPAWESGTSSHGFITSPTKQHQLSATRRQRTTTPAQQHVQPASPPRAQQQRQLPNRQRPVGIAAPRQDAQQPPEPEPIAFPKNTPRTISGCGRRGTTDGTATSACFNAPHGICTLSPGSVVVADCQNDRLRWLRRQPGSAEPGEWTATTVGGDSWHRPQGVCSAESGRAALVCDTGHHRVRIVQLPSDDAAMVGNAVEAEALVATLAGSGVRGHVDGPAEVAAFNGPSAVCFASDGSVVVADSGNCCIRRIARRRDGGTGLTVTTIAGPGARGHATPVGTAGYRDGAGFEALFASPSGITPCAGGRLLVVDRRNHALRLLIPPVAVDHGGAGNGWSVQTVVGHECSAGHVDGACAFARLSGPCDAVELADGSVLVTDSANHVLRRLDVHEASGDATVAQAAAATRPGEARRWLRSYKTTHGTWASAHSIMLPYAAAPPSAAEGPDVFAKYEPSFFLPRGLAVLEDNSDCSPKEVVLAIADSGNQRVRVVTLSGDNLCITDDEKNLMASARTERATAALLLNGGAGGEPRPLPPHGSFAKVAKQPSFTINEHADERARRMLEKSSAAAAQRLTSVTPCSPPQAAHHAATPSQNGASQKLMHENRRLRSLLNVAADKIEVLVAHIETHGIGLPSSI